MELIAPRCSLVVAGGRLDDFGFGGGERAEAVGQVLHALGDDVDHDAFAL